MKSRRWGPFRQDWYSICGKHRVYRPDCRLCQSGHWVNAWKRACGCLLFWLCPSLWRWWANRPNSASRKRIESLFPKLRKPPGETP